MDYLTWVLCGRYHPYFTDEEIDILSNILPKYLNKGWNNGVKTYAIINNSVMDINSVFF